MARCRGSAARDGNIDHPRYNHHGSRDPAKCIVLGIREQRLAIAKFIVDDFPNFDPMRPDDRDQFAVPASGDFTNQRPLGDEPTSSQRE